MSKLTGLQETILELVADTRAYWDTETILNTLCDGGIHSQHDRTETREAVVTLFTEGYLCAPNGTDDATWQLTQMGRDACMALEDPQRPRSAFLKELDKIG